MRFPSFERLLWIEENKKMREVVDYLYHRYVLQKDIKGRAPLENL